MDEGPPPDGQDGYRPTSAAMVTESHHRSPKSGRRRRWLVVVAALTILAAGLYTWRSFDEEHKPAATAPLLLYGNVEIRQVDLAFGAEGIISNVLVDEGDRVGSGQILAILDQEPFEQSRMAAAAALTSAEARLAELIAGSRPQEIDQAKASVGSAEAASENATISLRRVEQLFRSGNATPQAFDAALLVQRTTDAALRLARATLSLRVEGTRTEEIEQQRAEVEARRAALGIQNYRWAKSKLVAPNAGIVLTRIREPGAVVLPSSPVLTLSVIDPVWIRTYVDEPNLGRLIPGTRVRVDTDATPAKSYVGSIGYISPTAEFTPRSVEAPGLRTALVYRVRVLVKNPDQALRQGMPTTITVLPPRSEAPP